MTKKPLGPAELTELINGLNRLARNLWWTWNQESQEIFQELSPRGWQNLYHNAVAVLHEVSDYELRVRLQDPDFAERVRNVLRLFNNYLTEKNMPSLQATWVLVSSASASFIVKDISNRPSITTIGRSITIRFSIPAICRSSRSSMRTENLSFAPCPWSRAMSDSKHGESM